MEKECETEKIKRVESKYRYKEIKCENLIEI
jgi:hypothetical protein